MLNGGGSGGGGAAGGGAHGSGALRDYLRAQMAQTATGVAFQTLMHRMPSLRPQGSGLLAPPQAALQAAPPAASRKRSRDEEAPAQQQAAGSASPRQQAGGAAGPAQPAAAATALEPTPAAPAAGAVPSAPTPPQPGAAMAAAQGAIAGQGLAVPDFVVSGGKGVHNAACVEYTVGHVGKWLGQQLGQQ